MSVLIRDMELPESCWKCPFMYARVYCVAKNKLIFDDDEYSELNKRYDGCPLVEVPKPHGDLIDRDKLRAKEFIHSGDAYAVVMSRDVRNAPTVISSSEE